MGKDLNGMKWLLVDQIQDLTIGVVSVRRKLEELDPSRMANELVWFKRMCDIYLIISLAKLFEICDKYGKEINGFPDPIRSDLRDLKAEIERKKIYQYRSKYGAHIFDKDTGKPISLQKGEELFGKIVGLDLLEYLNFYEWIFPNEGYETKKSVLKTIESARDYLISIGVSGERP